MGREALDQATDDELRHCSAQKHGRRQAADQRGIFLSDDVMDYLLTRFSRDLQHLMALLERLDEFALSQRRAVTVPLLKRMFEQEGATL